MSATLGGITAFDDWMTSILSCGSSTERLPTALRGLKVVILEPNAPSLKPGVGTIGMLMNGLPTEVFSPSEP
jgi:hypothetical protein